MLREEVRGLWSRLEEFCRKFDDCIKDSRTRKHLRTYLKGQLSDLPRKSVEPIALEAGTPVRTLQEFLEIHRWDDQAAGRRLRELLQRNHGDANAIGVIDETSFQKKGKKTAGVQRQHCGAVGKLENCVVTVHLGFVSGEFHALLESDLYLPEQTWAGDRERRREAGIPEELEYRPKWRIALDLLERTLSEGVRLKWVTADEGYGRGLEFREGVEGLGLLYVVEIPSNLTGWTRRPQLVAAREGSAVRVPEEEGRAVSKLWKRGGPSWETWKVKETDKGPSVWEVRETPFQPSVRGYPGEELRLVIAREVLSGEIKYFLSNAPAEIGLGEVLHVAFSRWHIERAFEDGKGEVGMDHFEVRNYKPLMRHLLLSMISLYFLADQTERLKEKKLELDRVPGESGGGMPVGSEPLAA